MLLIEHKSLFFELRPQSLEDLWVLSEFIVPGDKVSSKDTRKVNVGNSKSKQVTKIINVELLVRKVIFDSQTLRVSGEIQNETEFTAIGQTHSLNFSLNDLLKIEKKVLLEFEEKLLGKAIDSKKSLHLLILLDKDELIGAEFGDFSFRVLLSEKGLGSKKYTQEQVNEEEQKYKLLESLLAREYAQIIIAGPSKFKDRLSVYIENKRGIKSLAFSWHDAHSDSIQKVIKAISEAKLLVNSQLSLEQEFVSKLLKRIDLGAKVSYGFKESSIKIEEGSVESLLLTTGFIQNLKEKGEYVSFNEKMKQIETMKGELIIVNSKHEPGSILDGLGGVAALLRY